MTPAEFRAIFPEFASAETYPEAQVDFWLRQATRGINADRWGEDTDTGTALATAHYLTIARQNMVAPGTGGGIIASKSVGDVSVSYDNTTGAAKGGTIWNSTSYGRQYWDLVRIYGAGAIQL